MVYSENFICYVTLYDWPRLIVSASLLHSWSLQNIMKSLNLKWVIHNIFYFNIYEKCFGPYKVSAQVSYLFKIKDVTLQSWHSRSSIIFCKLLHNDDGDDDDDNDKINKMFPDLQLRSQRPKASGPSLRHQPQDGHQAVERASRKPRLLRRGHLEDVRDSRVKPGILSPLQQQLRRPIHAT